MGQPIPEIAPGSRLTHWVDGALAALFAKQTNRLPSLIICPTESRAQQILAGLRLFNDQLNAGLIPEKEFYPYTHTLTALESNGARVAALTNISQWQIAVASVRSTMQRTLPLEIFTKGASYRTGEEIDPQQLLSSLVQKGFVQSPLVQNPGEFGARGDIVDFWPATSSKPVRLEFFGDQLESIRTFDPRLQTSLEVLESVSIHIPTEYTLTHPQGLRSRLLDTTEWCEVPSALARHQLAMLQEGQLETAIDPVLPALHESMVPFWDIYQSTSIAFVDWEACKNEATTIWERALEQFDSFRSNALCFPPRFHFLHPDALTGAPSIKAFHLPQERTPADLSLGAENLSTLRAALRARKQGKETTPLRPLFEKLEEWTSNGWEIVASADSAAKLKRLEAVLTHGDVAGVHFRVSDLEAGFQSTTLELGVVTALDIFGRKQSRSKRIGKNVLNPSLDFSKLEENAWLVHQEYGVAQFLKMTQLSAGGQTGDFLHLQFSDGQLYLPVYRLGEVHRYIAGENAKPKLDKLGGITWTKKRKKASKEAEALAEKLLQLYAQRSAAVGTAFTSHSEMVEDFEALFPFEETDDQKRAIAEVFDDLETTRPMDRLICGDVGFGKTEVAWRAAFKAIAAGAQVAFLAPTTVLVQQHYQNANVRFSEWPLTIGKLSRFVSKKEQDETLQKLRTGEQDLVIGTHRLLSSDVQFKKLGLVIVDEEQRFGVKQKERLKTLRKEVHVLSLSATPIPRTLHLALSGLRDLSLIATPPVDRRAINTTVAELDEGFIKRVIHEELSREGQVYFVCPRIDPSAGRKSIQEWKLDLETWLPGVSIGIAHGRMKPSELEKQMLRFVEGKTQILLSTTLIENGLDIPRANTMIIAYADMFGLSQLYQLRGRVGRSEKQAYCYLLCGDLETLSAGARERLATLGKYRDLGAGFHIAAHDLEMRGAGDLLGANQSGTVSAIGLEAFSRLLDEAVGRLKGTPPPSRLEPQLQCTIPAYIPQEYVSDATVRLVLYRDASSVENEEDLRHLRKNWRDRFGELPPQTDNLLKLMKCKFIAIQLGARALELTPTRVVIDIDQETAGTLPLHRQKLLELFRSPENRLRMLDATRIAVDFQKNEQKQPFAAATKALQPLLTCVITPSSVS